MKIVITGSRGFIGSALMKLLPQHKIVEYDTKIDKDISQFEIKKDTDFVVHLAALMDIRDSINHPELYWEQNVEYTKKIFKECSEAAIPMIYASSAAAKVWHLSPYGTTKKVCEELAPKGTVGLRFETVYGEGSSDFGLYGRIKSNQLKYKTNHIRDFVHVDDIAECLKMFINMKQYIFNLKPIYEVGTGIEHSVCDVVEAFKVDVPLTSEKTPYETDRSVADISAINALGWEAKRSIYDECNNKTFFYNVLEERGEFD